MYVCIGSGVPTAMAQSGPGLTREDREVLARLAQDAAAQAAAQAAAAAQPRRFRPEDPEKNPLIREPSWNDMALENFKRRRTS